MSSRYEHSEPDDELEVPFPPQYTDGLGHKVQDVTVNELYKESYGERGVGWFPRFNKAALGGVAIVAIVITAEGWRHFRNKHPDESID